MTQTGRISAAFPERPGRPLAFPLVQIRTAAAAKMTRHMYASLPRECCGVLLGRAWTITDAQAVRNVSGDDWRFELDAIEQARCERDARPAELDVLGYYHSHVQGAALPSVDDRRGTLWPHLAPPLHLILHPGGARHGRHSLRLWRVYLVRESWRPARLRVVSSGGASDNRRHACG